MMVHYTIAYLCTALVFLTIDFVWLSYIAKNMYMDSLGHLMLDDVNIKIAAGFYLMYGIGMVIFAVNPALVKDQWQTALILGALFGFFCYAAYDFTNMATLKDWPIKMSIIDMAWGTFVTSVASTSGFFLTKYVTKLILEN